MQVEIVLFYAKLEGVKKDVEMGPITLGPPAGLSEGRAGLVSGVGLNNSCGLWSVARRGSCSQPGTEPGPAIVCHPPPLPPAVTRIVDGHRHRSSGQVIML